MKKITRCAIAISIIFSSCTKEPSWSRSFTQPLDSSHPTGVRSGHNIPWYEGMSDEECIKKIKTLDSYDPTKVIFLSPNLYTNGDGEEKTVNLPNPDYMVFPHSINSMASTWSWDYIDEMNELKKEYGSEGMQMFLDKYLQGDSTLGMKLNKNF